MRDKKRLTFLKQNSGVSLVELIVVISIMAVLTGLVVLSVGIIPQNRVRACARELVERFELLSALPELLWVPLQVSPCKVSVPLTVSHNRSG